MAFKTYQIWLSENYSFDFLFFIISLNQLNMYASRLVGQYS